MSPALCPFYLRQLSRNKRNLCSFSMQFLIPPAGGALFSHWTTSFLFWMSRFFFFCDSVLSLQTAQSSVRCATHSPSHHDTGLFATESLRGKGNPIQHDLGTKGAILPSSSEESWCPSHANYTREIRLNIMSRHPFQVLMTDPKIQQTKKSPVIVITNAGVSRLGKRQDTVDPQGFLSP